MKYVKVRVLNPQNSKQDQDAFLRQDQITKIFTVPKETKETKQVREEVNAFIETANGFTYQTAEKPETIIERLGNADILPFNSDTPAE